MSNINEDLLSFWDASFNNLLTDTINGKWVEDENFNNCVKKYIKDDSNVLDYGCGSGWAIMEIAYTVKLKGGLGIDPSKNAIDYLLRTKKASNLDFLDFKVGDQNLLNDYHKYFDNAVSFNVIDVLPDDIIKSILKNISLSLKKDGYFIVGINPSFPKDFLDKNGFIEENGYLFKNGILRLNIKTDEQWKELFSQYFKVVDFFLVSLTEGEKKVPRRVFVLKNI